jgi:hypothetical protein
MAGRLILSSLNWMHRWYNPNKSATPEQIADIFFNMLFNGLRTGELTELPTSDRPKATGLKAARRKSR